MPTEPQATRADSAEAAAPTARMTYRRLRVAGLSAREAASLTGHLAGLHGVPGGWSIEEVERLLFVRELVRTERMGS
jgi:hypothetical protein